MNCNEGGKNCTFQNLMKVLFFYAYKFCVILRLILAYIRLCTHKKGEGIEQQSFFYLKKNRIFLKTHLRLWGFETSGASGLNFEKFSEIRKKFRQTTEDIPWDVPKKMTVVAKLVWFFGVRRI
jgi:hypothetical protein